MKKTTLKHSNKLTKRLLQYSALSVAMSGVSEMNGQIVYTDVNPDITEGNMDTATFIDLNNDGTDDFGIGTNDDPAVGINGVSSNASWVGSSASYLYPFALDTGVAISSGQTTWFGNGDVGTLNYTSCYNGAGGSNWCGVTDKYMGLRFQIAGNTHYGWARLDVSLSGDSFTLKDYAYNTVAGEAIDAGQTLSVSEFDAPTAYHISCNDKWVTISNIQGEANYKVISLSGQTVLTSSTRLETQAIDLNGLATGIYIVEVSNTEKSRVKRKKIVIQ